jgi:hypothetical protein
MDHEDLGMYKVGAIPVEPIGAPLNGLIAEI